MQAVWHSASASSLRSSGGTIVAIGYFSFRHFRRERTTPTSAAS